MRTPMASVIRVFSYDEETAIDGRTMTPNAVVVPLPVDIVVKKSIWTVFLEQADRVVGRLWILQNE